MKDVRTLSEICVSMLDVIVHSMKLIEEISFQDL